MNVKIAVLVLTALCGVFIGYSNAQTTQAAGGGSVSTTSANAADCANRFQQLIVDANNQTAYTRAIEAAYATWDAKSQKQFKKNWNKIRKAVYNTKLSATKIFKKVLKQTKKFGKKKLGKANLYPVNIPEWHGTVQQFVKCGKKLVL